MKAEISLAEISAPAELIALVKQAETDLLTAGRIQKANWIEFENAVTQENREFIKSLSQ